VIAVLFTRLLNHLARAQMRQTYFRATPLFPMASLRELSYAVARFKMIAAGGRLSSTQRRTGARRAAGDARSTRLAKPVSQLGLPFPATWGGARANAGRKPGPRSGVPHRARPQHRAWQPVHVTLRARMKQLRSQFVFPTVQLALLRATRRAAERFRIVHFSVQHHHIHLVVEASDRRALASGVSGLAIRIARYVNDLLMRRGRFWAERWHGRALKTPREVRHAIVYVLANARKHARAALPAGIDPYSSARWFDGWRDFPAPEFRHRSSNPAPFATTSTSDPRRSTLLPRPGCAGSAGGGTASSPSRKRRSTREQSVELMVPAERRAGRRRIEGARGSARRVAPSAPGDRTIGCARS
jgi:REP element-mobilizing transposase RayT